MRLTDGSSVDAHAAAATATATSATAAQQQWRALAAEKFLQHNKPGELQKDRSKEFFLLSESEARRSSLVELVSSASADRSESESETEKGRDGPWKGDEPRGLPKYLADPPCKRFARSQSGSAAHPGELVYSIIMSFSASRIALALD